MAIDQLKPKEVLLNESNGGHAPAGSNVAAALLNTAFLYASICIIYLLVAEMVDDEFALAFLHIGSASSLLLFWRQVNWGSGKYDSFGAAMLLIGAMLKFQAALDTLVYGTRVDEIPLTVMLPASIPRLFLKSEALSFLGMLLLSAVWRSTVGDRVGQFSFLKNYRQVGRQLPLVIYAVAIAVEISKRLAGADFGALTQISSITYSFGVAAIFFIAALQKSRIQRILLAVLLGLPVAALASSAGMKEAMFFPLIPAAVLFWFGYTSGSARIAAICAGFVILAYSQLYVQYVREVNWNTDNKMTISELMAGFQSRLDGMDLASGMNAISSRMNMSTSRAITVAIADARGFEPMNIFGPIPSSFIPRVFWSDKPILQPGAQHTFRIQDIDAPAFEATSATAAGFFSELYLGGGYLGWIIGVLIYGFLMAKIQLFTLRRLLGFGHLALSFVAVYWALRFEENQVAYAYTALFFVLIFLYFLIKMTSSVKIKS